MNGKDVTLEKRDTPEDTIAALNNALKEETQKRLTLEKELLEIQEMTNTGSYYLDFNAGIWTSSPELDRIFGIDDGFVRSIEGWLSIVHSEYRQLMRNYFKGLTDNKKRVFNKEYMIRNISTGEELWVLGLGHISYDKADKPLTMIGTIQDISQRVKAEKSLRESDERFSRAFYENPVPMQYVDLETGKRLFINKSMETLTGYSKNELFDKNVFSSSLGLNPDKLMEFGKRIRHNKIVRGFPAELLTKDNKIKHILINASVLKLQNRDVFISSYEDISKIKEAEEKLRYSEEKFYKAFFEHPTPMQILNFKTGERIDVNDSLIEFLSTDRETFLSTNLFDNIFFKDPARLEELKNALLKHRKISGIEIMFETLKGDQKHGLFSASILDLPGESLCVIELENITAQKETERSLKSALKELEQAKKQIEEENIYLMQEINQGHNYSHIIGKSKAILTMLKQIELVAGTDSAVLIHGETGTGKELVARAIHDNSNRKNRPLIKVNCPAIPSELIESELFGHEKGAFTGATQRKIGRFELADKGTIFLDEIGDLPLHLQVKLLRVLQEGEFERVGIGKPIKVDVRVIAASNRDLEQLVLEGKFRQDLYFRLNVFPIYAPALRERKEDIPLLVTHFIDVFNKKMGRKVTSIPNKAMEKLMNCNWPGNVRELANVIERSMVVSLGNKLALGNWLNQNNSNGKPARLLPLAEFEKQYITEVLEKTMWRIRGEGGAARILDMKPTTLESKMKKLGIKR